MDNLTIEKLEIVTSNNSYELAKGLPKNPERTLEAIESYSKSLNNALTTEETEAVMVNANINASLFGTYANCVVLEENSIELNTSTTSNYSYVIPLKSKLAIPRITTTEGARTLSYIPFISGSSRACLTSTNITLTNYDETEEYQYSYNWNLSLRVQEGYAYQSRYSPPRIVPVFITNIGVIYNSALLYIRVNLTQDE